jgi:hypothetical protein
VTYVPTLIKATLYVHTTFDYIDTNENKSIEFPNKIMNIRKQNILVYFDESLFFSSVYLLSYSAIIIKKIHHAVFCLDFRQKFFY